MGVIPERLNILHWDRKKEKKENSFLRLSHQRLTWLLLWERELRDSWDLVHFDSDLNQGKKKYFLEVKKNPCKLPNRGGKHRNMVVYIHLWLQNFLSCGTNDWKVGVRQNCLKVVFAWKAHCFTSVICYRSICWSRFIKMCFSVFARCW